MTKLLRGGVAALLLACASAAPAIEISVVEPGFLSIDGVYYGFGLRQPAPPAPTFARIALLGSEGFYLHTLFDPGECRRVDGSAPTLVAEGTPRLRFADLPLSPETPADGLALATTAPGQPASVRLSGCRGINVLHWRSADGDVACDQRIRFPFERGECPQLDLADPGYIHHGSFE